VVLGASLDRLANLPRDLADRENLLDTGRGRGDEVEHASKRAESPDDRHAEIEAQVLAQRRLGVHGHREHTRVHLSRCEPDLAFRGITGNLDVRELVRRNADLATLGVGEPQQRIALPYRGLDGGTHGARVVVHLEDELARAVNHSDAYFHAVTLVLASDDL